MGDAAGVPVVQVYMVLAPAGYPDMWTPFRMTTDAQHALSTADNIGGLVVTMPIVYTHDEDGVIR